MKFRCVMLGGILVSCSHGRANATGMLAKVTFNKIAQEMDMRGEERRGEESREEKRRETRRCVVRVVYVVWRVCTST